MRQGTPTPRGRGDDPYLDALDDVTSWLTSMRLTLTEFRPAAYRAALDEICTHVEALRARRDDYEVPFG